MPKLEFVRPEDCEAIYAIESEAFPADEAANLEGIVFRQRVAPKYFMKYVEDDGTIIGYVNGTKCIENEITHDSMSEHKAEGETLIIHSVTISAPFRKNGHGSAMLKAYIMVQLELLKKGETSVKSILLLCKQNLRHFYEESVGLFDFIRESPVVHGQDTWYELGMSTQDAK